LYGNQAALIPLLLGKEETVKIDEEDDGHVLTVEQLASMNGAQDSTPLYIAIKGRVYDVSAARDMYGVGKPYHVFVGKDATRAFATGCMEEHCMVSSMDGLNEQELKEVDRWVELYQNHDKYTFVGRLIEDPIESMVDREIKSQSIDELNAKLDDVIEIPE
jgi:predicted heme/steroid binding protein